MMAVEQDGRPFAVRFWLYLGERFPLAHHCALIAALAVSAVCYSALVRSDGAVPSVTGLGVAALVLLITFFQLRVADEHKDAADDAQFRPERAVPRGLISLKELAGVALVGAGVQVVVLALYHPPLLGLLAMVWAWAWLTRVEFFIPDWLKARPVIYMVSHMAIMPIVDVLATACEWAPVDGVGLGDMAQPLAAYLALSLACGACLEVARKCWAPGAERAGVETYSRLWGPGRAGVVLAGLIGLSFLIACVVNAVSPASPWWLFMSGLPAAAGVWCALSYARNPVEKTAGRLEISAGVFVLMAYLASGPASMGVRIWMG